MAQYNNFDPELDELTPEDKALLLKQAMGGQEVPPKVNYDPVLDSEAVSNPYVDRQYNQGVEPDIRRQMIQSTNDLYDTKKDPYADAIEANKPNILQRVFGAMSAMGGSSLKDIQDMQNAKTKTAIEAEDRKRQMLKDRIMGLKTLADEQRITDQEARTKQMFPIELQAKQQGLDTAKAAEARAAQGFGTEQSIKQENLKKAIFENKLMSDPAQAPFVEQAKDSYRMAFGKEPDAEAFAKMSQTGIKQFIDDNNKIIAAKNKPADTTGAIAGQKEFEKQTAKDDAEFVNSYQTNEKQAQDIKREYELLKQKISELPEEGMITGNSPGALKLSRENPGIPGSQAKQWASIKSVINRIGARNVKKLFPGQTSNFEVSTALAQVADPNVPKKDLLANIDNQMRMINSDISQSAEKYNKVASKRNLEPKTDVKQPEVQSFGPAVGTIKNGYKFKGGNPNDQNNWEKI